MAWGSRMIHLFRRFHGRRTAEQDLDDEVQSYFEILTERAMARGLSREEAQRAARVQFEGAEQVKQRVREERVGASIETVLHDIRYAWRSLKKSPFRRCWAEPSPTTRIDPAAKRWWCSPIACG